MTIAERIHNRRKELGLTLEEVGEAIGTTKSTMHKYETGKIQKLPTNIIEPLAKVLDVTPDYLFGWSEEEKETYKREAEEADKREAMMYTLKVEEAITKMSKSTRQRMMNILVNAFPEYFE